MKRTALYLTKAAATGVLGWIILIGAFEAAYWGEAWWHRKKGF